MTTREPTQRADEARPDQPSSHQAARLNTPPEQVSWTYTGSSERGRALHFSGHVTYLGGAEGERLRGELSAVMGDLLRWAVVARNAAEDLSDHHEDTTA